LARQHHALQEWLAFAGNAGSESNLDSSAITTQKAVTQRLETLRYIHADTFQLGRQLLDNAKVWDRYNDADKHVVNATFLEVRARHANTVESVVDVVTNVRQLSRHEVNADGSTPSTISSSISSHEDMAQEFLQRRLGVQLLCDHHVEMYKGKKSNGGISVQAPLSLSLSDAVLEAQHIVDVHLQVYPETHFEPAVTDATCTMVQPWVHHALVELLKNAMASAVAKMKLDHQNRNTSAASSATTPSPLLIRVREVTGASNGKNGSSDIAVDIVDRGIGVADIDAAFALGHSSAGRKWDRLDEQQSYAAVRSPLSSLGVGLPIFRYMMEHFGGSLTLTNNNSTNGSSGEDAGCTATILFPCDDTILERIPGDKT
jgi:pyruvate dehydrogenase kinase 2/3/4